VNHYDTLGVPKDADSETIKRAYKKKAQKAHPDRGGTQDEFRAVAKAYGILSSPERRRRYDQTGEDGQIDEHAAMMNQIAGLVLQIIEQANDIATTDVLKVARQHIEGEIGRIGDERMRMGKKQLKLQRAAKRLKRKSAGESVLEAMVGAEAARLTTNMEIAKGRVAQLQRMQRLLDDYKYEVDPPSRAQFIVGGAGDSVAYAKLVDAFIRDDIQP
jgi:DnaJ-class molecular chaperone